MFAHPQYNNKHTDTPEATPRHANKNPRELPKKICLLHKLQYTHICTSPECFNFRLLCPECCREDIYYHPKMTLEEARLYYRRISSHMEQTFRQLREKINNEVDNCEDYPRGFKEVDEILSTIMEQIQKKFQESRQKLKMSYFNQMAKQLQELFYQIDASEEELKMGVDEEQMLAKVFRNDIQYNLKYIESYFNQLVNKSKKHSGWVINNDSVKRLVMSFDKNLKDVIEKIKVKDLDDLQAKLSPRQCTPHLFQGSTFFSFNLQRQTVQSREIQVPVVEGLKDLNREAPSNKFRFDNIPTSIYFTSQWSETNTSIYVFGDGNMKPSDQIYRYDAKANMLIKRYRMKVERSNMSACILKDQIYIIGGYNEKEGALVKCEKYNPDQNKIYLVNSLNERSCMHTCIPFKDRYIFKFGGVKYNLHPKIMCENVVEVYISEIDEWKKLEVLSPVDLHLYQSYLCGALQLSDSQLIVFGGRNEFQNLTSQKAYSVTVTEDQKQIKQIRFNNIEFMKVGDYLSVVQYNKDLKKAYFFKHEEGQVSLEEYDLADDVWDK